MGIVCCGAADEVDDSSSSSSSGIIPAPGDAHNLRHAFPSSFSCLIQIIVVMSIPKP